MKYTITPLFLIALSISGCNIDKVDSNLNQISKGIAELDRAINGNSAGTFQNGMPTSLRRKLARSSESEPSRKETAYHLPPPIKNLDTPGSIKLLNEAPLALVKLCILPFNSIQCFTVERVDANDKIIEIDALVANQILELKFHRAISNNSKHELYIEEARNKSCDVVFYKKPIVNREDSEFRFVFLGRRTCYSEFITILIPKDFQASKNAINQQQRVEMNKLLYKHLRKFNYDLLQR